MADKKGLFESLLSMGKIAKGLGGVTRDARRITHNTSSTLRSASSGVDSAKSLAKKVGIGQPAKVNDGVWKCVCGRTSQTAFCGACGSSRPVCAKCGSFDVASGFCTNCGTPHNGGEENED